ncbi:hypothetical protein [Gelatiniphilus marinus]|uniref:Uncharacterized protein n=1 Tax=Gelatiniphilus marinus TaxID=1759464 RepID=A0ABW5JS06_9FLAO
MKKLSYIILGIIIGALATYYYCPRQIDDGATEIVKPKGVITPDQAMALNNNWTKYRKAAVDSAAARQGREIDDRSTWWSIKNIENYIAYSKKQTDSLGYTITGLRVYLGVYGENAGRTKRNLTTMFVVPTVKKAKDKASMNPFAFQDEDEEDCEECEPLNEGGNGGGGSGYPN